MPIVVMGTEAARRGAHFAGTARHGKSGLNGVLRVFWNCIECCKIRIIDAGGVVAVVMAALLPVDQHMCDVQLAATVNSTPDGYPAYPVFHTPTFRMAIRSSLCSVALRSILSLPPLLDYVRKLSNHRRQFNTPFSRSLAARTLQCTLRTTHVIIDVSIHSDIYGPC